MRMHAQPFAEDGRRKLHGQNLAAALLEGAFQRMESALREPGGEIPGVALSPSILCKGEGRHVHACKMVALATGFSSGNVFSCAFMHMACS